MLNRRCLIRLAVGFVVKHIIKDDCNTDNNNDCRPYYPLKSCKINVVTEQQNYSHKQKNKTAGFIFICNQTDKRRNNDKQCPPTIKKQVNIDCARCSQTPKNADGDYSNAPKNTLSFFHKSTSKSIFNFKVP